MINTDTPLGPELDDARKVLSLGEFASRREDLGLTLSDVFVRTRISVKNLTALERGGFASLPAPVYTRDFIRQYAKVLDINPHQALQEYGAYLQSLEKQIVVAGNAESEVRPETKPEVTPEVDIYQNIFPKKKSSSVLFLSAILVIALIGLLVFLLGNNTIQQTQRHSTDQQAVKSLPLSQEGAVSDSEGISTDGAAVAPVPGPAVVEGEMLQKAIVKALSGTTLSGSLKLTVKARETTWIGVRINDQQKEQETTLYAGGTATFTGNSFWLNIGNAGGTDVFLQGKPLPPLGKKGEAIRIALPPKNQ